MIVLDTNVISEPMRLIPAEPVAAWMRRQAIGEVFVTTTSEAEMWFGIERLPQSPKRELLEAQITAIFDRDFAGRVLSFDSPAARAYGEIVASIQRMGKNIAPLDAQIAAIARVRGAILATRNTRHFADCGVELVDPWAA